MVKLPPNVPPVNGNALLAFANAPVARLVAELACVNAPLAKEPALVANVEVVLANVNAPFAYDCTNDMLVFCVRSTPWILSVFV